MLKRRARALIESRLREYPAVGLVGPRQCGKTTLAREMGLYFDLEQEADRLRLDLEWERLAEGDELLVLDEAQSWPQVFTRLRGAIDRQRGRKGRFLLLGSVAPSLMTQVSESLAGRLSLVELTPFLMIELADKPADSLWLRGGYPDGGVLGGGSYPQWQRDYLTLLIRRDLPNWGLSASPQTTERLLKMICAVHGQTWNASQIGQSLGLSYHTINGYLDYLEGAFLVRRLPSYSANIRKRTVKAPKIYVRDSGLLHVQMNVADEASLIVQPWVGASWEGFVLEQVIGTLTTTGAPFEAFYFRTSDRHELDLVIQSGRELLAIEVKLSSSPGPSDMDRLEKAADLIKASRRYLVSKTPRTAGDERRASCNLPWLLERLQDTVGK